MKTSLAILLIISKKIELQSWDKNDKEEDEKSLENTLTPGIEL